MFDFITSLIDSIGPAGVALLMFLENVFPPIPSELIMPLAGYAAARGDMSLAAVIVAGTAGSLAGAAFWAGIGRAIGRERLVRFCRRYGRWLTVSVEDVDRAQAWFDRRGTIAVLFGRLVPTIRTLISVPAGLARMPWGRFLVWSGIGTAAWTALLAVAGYMLGDRYEVVGAWVDPVSTAVVVAIVLIYLWRVVTWKG